MEFTFKATGMFDIYSDANSPEYYTVLAKKKGKGNKWVYCANNGEILKFETMKEAKLEAKALTESK
jgi:hypothetical protein